MEEKDVSKDNNDYSVFSFYGNSGKEENDNQSKRRFQFQCCKCKQIQTLTIEFPELFSLPEPRRRICRACYNNLPKTKIKRWLQFRIMSISDLLFEIHGRLD